VTPAWIEGGPGQAADICVLRGLVMPLPTMTILELLFCFDKGWEQTNFD